MTELARPLLSLAPSDRRMGEQHAPAVMTALVRSDDIIAFATVQLQSKQQELQRCIEVGNQVLRELDITTERLQRVTEERDQLMMTRRAESTTPPRSQQNTTNAPMLHSTTVESHRRKMLEAELSDALDRHRQLERLLAINQDMVRSSERDAQAQGALSKHLNEQLLAKETEAVQLSSELDQNVYENKELRKLLVNFAKDIEYHRSHNLTIITTTGENNNLSSTTGACHSLAGGSLATAEQRVALTMASPFHKFKEMLDCAAREFRNATSSSQVDHDKVEAVVAENSRLHMLLNNMKQESVSMQETALEAIKDATLTIDPLIEANDVLVNAILASNDGENDRHHPSSSPAFHLQHGVELANLRRELKKSQMLCHRLQKDALAREKGMAKLVQAAVGKEVATFAAQDAYHQNAVFSVEALRATTSALQSENSSLQRELERRLIEVGNLTKDLESTKETLQQYHQRNRQLEQDARGGQEEVRSQRQIIAGLKQEMENSKTVQSLSLAVEERQSSQRIADLEKQLAVTTAKHQEAQRELLRIAKHRPSEKDEREDDVTNAIRRSSSSTATVKESTAGAGGILAMMRNTATVSSPSPRLPPPGPHDTHDLQVHHNNDHHHHPVQRPGGSTYSPLENPSASLSDPAQHQQHYNDITATKHLSSAFQSMSLELDHIRKEFRAYREQHSVPTIMFTELQQDCERLRQELQQARSDAIALRGASEVAELAAKKNLSDQAQLVTEVKELIKNVIGDSKLTVSTFEGCARRLNGKHQNSLRMLMLCSVSILRCLLTPLLKIAPSSSAHIPSASEDEDDLLSSALRDDVQEDGFGRSSTTGVGLSGLLADWPSSPLGGIDISPINSQRRRRQQQKKASSPPVQASLAELAQIIEKVSMVSPPVSHLEVEGLQRELESNTRTSQQEIATLHAKNEELMTRLQAANRAIDEGMKEVHEALTAKRNAEAEARKCRENLMSANMAVEEASHKAKMDVAMAKLRADELSEQREQARVEMETAVKREREKLISLRKNNDSVVLALEQKVEELTNRSAMIERDLLEKDIHCKGLQKEITQRDQRLASMERALQELRNHKKSEDLLMESTREKQVQELEEHNSELRLKLSSTREEINDIRAKHEAVEMTFRRSRDELALRLEVAERDLKLQQEQAYKFQEDVAQRDKKIQALEETLHDTRQRKQAETQVAHSNTIRELEKKMEETRKEKEQLLENYVTIEQECERRQKKCNHLQRGLSQRDQQLLALEKQLHEAQLRADENSTSHLGHENQVRQLELQNEELANKLASTREEVIAMRAAIQEVVAQQEYIPSRTSTPGAQQQQPRIDRNRLLEDEDTTGWNTAAIMRIRDLKEQLVRLEDKCSRLHVDVDKYKRRATQATAERDRLVEGHAADEATIAALTTQLSTLEVRLETVEKDRDRLRNQLHELLQAPRQ